MHYNNVRIIKAKHKTLHDVTLKDEVWHITNSCYVKLESVLMKLKNESQPLFLAAEQGAGNFSNNANAVINPKVEMHSKYWLFQDDLLLTLKNMKEMKISVVVQNTQYDE